MRLTTLGFVILLTVAALVVAGCVSSADEERMNTIVDKKFSSSYFDTVTKLHATTYDGKRAYQAIYIYYTSDDFRNMNGGTYVVTLIPGTVEESKALARHKIADYTAEGYIPYDTNYDNQSGLSWTGDKNALSAAPQPTVMVRVYPSPTCLYILEMDKGIGNVATLHGL